MLLFQVGAKAGVIAFPKNYLCKSWRTAYIAVAVLFNLFAFVALAKAAPNISKYSAYLFVYFTGNDKKEEAIRFALSNDGYHYRALNNNNPVVNSADIHCFKNKFFKQCSFS